MGGECQGERNSAMSKKLNTNPPSKKSAATGHPTDTPRGAGQVDPGLKGAEAKDKGALGHNKEQK